MPLAVPVVTRSRRNALSGEDITHGLTPPTAPGARPHRPAAPQLPPVPEPDPEGSFAALMAAAMPTPPPRAPIPKASDVAAASDLVAIAGELVALRRAARAAHPRNDANAWGDAIRTGLAMPLRVQLPNAALELEQCWWAYVSYYHISADTLDGLDRIIHQLRRAESRASGRALAALGSWRGWVRRSLVRDRDDVRADVAQMEQLTARLGTCLMLLAYRPVWQARQVPHYVVPNASWHVGTEGARQLLYAHCEEQMAEVSRLRNLQMVPLLEALDLMLQLA